MLTAATPVIRCQHGSVRKHADQSSPATPSTLTLSPSVVRFPALRPTPVRLSRAPVPFPIPKHLCCVSAPVPYYHSPFPFPL